MSLSNKYDYHWLSFGTGQMETSVSTLAVRHISGGGGGGGRNGCKMNCRSMRQRSVVTDLRLRSDHVMLK